MAALLHNSPDKFLVKSRVRFRDRSLARRQARHQAKYLAKFRDSFPSLDRPVPEDFREESRRAFPQDSGLIRTASWSRSRRGNRSKERPGPYQDNLWGSSPAALRIRIRR